ncbi:Translocation/assembly module TamB [Flavobacterium longum]|uniref:translocation/assembly module TamB domain-containing protein n=1 Tax=Flavobacterium longum TaxID=1299340 RepID=UPI0039EC5C66
MSKKKIHPYVKRTLKILAWIVGTVIGLFLLLVLLLQFSFFQNFVKDKAVAYIEGKIKTPVKIESIEIGLPKKVILTGFYFESQQKDTLLAGEKLAVDMSLFKLFSNEVEINSIKLSGATANLKRGQDSVFNFQYIIDAFASDAPKTDSEPMKISVRKITLDDIRFTLDDAISKNKVAIKLTHFDTRFRNFDLDAMDFNIPEINLDGLKLTLDQGLVERIAETSVKVADTVSKRPDFKLKLGTVALSNIDVGYDNAGSRLNTGLRLGKLVLDFETLDIARQNIALNNLELKNVSGNLALGQLDKNIKTPDTDTTAIKKQGWKLKLDKVDIANVNFKFDDANAKAISKGIDYKHLDIQGFNAKAKGISFADDNISGNIQSFAVKEKSGVDVQAFRAEFAYSDRGASLKNLYLKTPQTLVKDHIVVRYPSLDAIKKNPSAVTFDANIDQSRIGFRDILTFVPTLENTNPFKANPDAILYLDTKLSGRLDDIRFPKFALSGIGNTRISASGRVTGLPDPKKLGFDIVINDLQTTAKDINNLVPKGAIPANIALPQNIRVVGSAKGNAENFSTNLNISSSYGGAKAIALFDRRVKDREKYDADVTLNEFNIGQLIQNKLLGKVSLTAKVKGTGLNPKTANAVVDALLKNATYNGYRYQNLALSGNIQNGLFAAKANMNDPNLTFALDAGGGFNDKYPSVQMKLNVDVADLQKLNLHAGPMKLRGNVVADIPTADPDYLNGDISVAHLQILADKDPILLDSIKISAVSTADRNSLRIQSQILKANFEGKYQLSKLADAIQNTIAKYYDATPRRQRKTTPPQQIAFDIQIDNDPVIFQLVPQITGLEPIAIIGNYNSQGDSLRVDASIPRLVYGANTIAGANVNLETRDGALAYSADIDAIQGSQFRLPFTSISGEAKDNVLTYNLQIRDSGKKDQYVINGRMQSVDGNTEIRLNPEGLKLNYDDWTIAPDNVLRFGKDGIFADDFELSREGNVFKLQSESMQANAPLRLEFTDFSLKTLTNLIKKDELLADGTLNGNVLLKNLAGRMEFTSDLNITGFSFRGEPVGDIAIKVNNQVADTYAADVVLSGNGNDVKINGFYKAASQSFDLNLDLNQLNVSSVQGFTMGNIKDGKGALRGNFKITGTADSPRVNGDLNFDDVAFRVTQLNSYFKDINEKIVVNGQGIFFDKFTVYDEKNNKLALNGAMLTTNFREYTFNLGIDAENFRAVNSKASDNDLYYGDLFLDADLKVRGTLENPVVSGNIKVNEDTKFTVVLPQSDPGIAEREGIVEFVDEDQVLLQQTATMKNELNQSNLTGVDVSVNIQTDKEALLSLVIDKGNGDYLNLKGEADLTGGIDPSGKTTLTGKYEFTEGAYEMTFNLIKRKFEIEKGSYIIWTGEPTSANLSITAIYKVNAAPIDLLDDQLGGLAPAVRNTYKQRLPFQTHLKMNGELLKPEITFDIVLPDGSYGVSGDIIEASQTKLAQLRQEPSELNKQVFALLLLNRFIGENPFSSESGATANTLARQSVSKILSQQLNNLAGELIKGVEVNFDLESTEDYTSGSREDRTDLNVAVSKKLLNDRLKVTVGSSFGVEGQRQTSEETNNIAGDLSAEYQLTQDGRYLVRAYRKNQYEMALQGQVIETGVAFVVTMDYNRFQELFHRTEEEKELKRREREKKQEAKARKAAEAEKQKDDESKPVQDEK